MAHIVNFNITGLLGRKKPYKQTLNRNTNVFFGKNGGGKTSLLRILNAAMEIDARKLQSISFSSAEVNVYSVTAGGIVNHKYDRPGSLENSELSDFFDLSEDGIGNERAERNDAWQVSPSSITDDGRPVRGWRHRYLPTTRLYVADRRFASLGAKERALSEDDLDRYFSESVQKMWGRRFGEVVRDVGHAQHEGLQLVLAEVLSDRGKPAPDKMQSELRPERAYEKMDRFLKRQSSVKIAKLVGTKNQFFERYREDAFLRRVVNHIDRIEDRIDDLMKPIEQLSDLVKKMFSNGKIVKFDGPTIRVETDDGKQIGLEKLSSGEKHLIRILLDAMDVGPGALIIDEPELSLHIDWQRDLIKNIHALNPNCQLIMATHSPEIMSEIDDSMIFRL